MPHPRVLFAALIAILSGTFQFAIAQEPPETPTVDVQAQVAAWQSMTNAQFVEAVVALFPDRGKWSPEVRTAFNEASDEEVARRLRALQTITQEDYPHLYRMSRWGTNDLTPEEQQQVAQRLLAFAAANEQLSYDQMKATYLAQRTLKGPLNDRIALAKAWFDGRDLAELSFMQLDWAEDVLANAPGNVNNTMTVTWTGQITPPQTGEYRFSGSPTQIYLDYPHLRAESKFSVWINNELVYELAVGEATQQPVQLTAATPATIRVELVHDHSHWRVSGAHPAIAQLYWQGPGIQRQLVPSSALSSPQGGGSGLLGQYTVIRGKDAQGNPLEPLSVQKLDPQIDFVWTTGRSFLLQDRAPARRILEELTARTAQPALRAEIRTMIEEGKVRTLRNILKGKSDLMTSDQRATWLRNLAEDEALLQAMIPGALHTIYYPLRVGAEEEAIDLIGRWAQLHSADPPKLAMNYFSANRQPLYWIADHLTNEYSEGFGRLEEEYLEGTGGSCVLPVAYMAAYSHAFRGELPEWIETIDARLSDNSLSGDARATWLLAMAQAQEIRGNRGPLDRFEKLPERYHAGWDFLDEASLTADSEAMKLRIFEEKLSRLASAQQFDRVQALMQSEANRLQSPTAQQRLADLNEGLTKLQEDQTKALAAQQKAAQARYVKELERRKQRAEAANDSDAVARYNALIERAQPQEQNP